MYLDMEKFITTMQNIWENFYNWLPEGTGYKLYHSGQIESGKIF